MKRIFRKLAAIALILALITALAACGDKTANQNSNSPAAPAASDSPAAPASPEASAGSADAVYTIGFNTWGSGVPILDLFGDETAYALDVLKMDGNRVSDNFTADTELQNIQNFIARQVDGIAMQVSADPVLPQASDACKNAEIPFVLLVFVGDDNDRAQVSANNPYYAGAVNSDLYYDGYVLGQIAIRDGNKTALIHGGNIGDNNMDQRIDGFTQSFVVEGGGTILDESRCTSPAESQQKASDLLSTYRDADCLYALVGDYVPGPVNAMETLNITEMKIYASCVDLVTADYIREGKVTLGNDGIGLSAVLAPALLINYLDGHPIVDANGKAPEFKTIPFIVDKDNVDDYVSIFYTPGVHPINEDLLKTLVWRYNPNVSYQTYADLIESGLTLDALLKVHGK